MKKYLLSLATLFITLLTTSVFAENYKIIIDAGSTGSRLHLFQYDDVVDGAVPVVKDFFSVSNKQALSSFVKNPQAAGASLTALLDGAVSQLKAKQVDTHLVEINVLATAGMRLLPNDAQSEIYASVLATLQDPEKNYGFKMGHVETISGEKEALYGWLDINYLAENFQNHTPTIGSIDMGGASTQIAFATQDKKKPYEIISFNLGGQPYNVFAKSFLGLGQDQAREAMTLDALATFCYPAGYQIDSDRFGYFKFRYCSPLFSKLISKHKVANQLVSTKNQKFVAYSGAYYTYNFFAADQTPEKADFKNKFKDVCKRTWDQLKLDYPNVDPKYISSYCANAVYMTDLFYDTYQLGKGQLSVSAKINGKSIDWTLGAMLFDVIQQNKK